MGRQPAWRLPFSARVTAACVTLLAATALAGTAHGAAFPFASPLAAGFPVANQTGVAAPAVTPGQRAAALKATTGLSLSQVSAQRVCSTPASGRASCDAQVLVSSSSHQLVHTSIPAQKTFGLILSHRGGANPFAITTPTPASPPTPTTPAYLQQAYDLSYLSQSAGGGDTVAIVDAYDDPNAESDLNVFRSHYGLSACTTANGCFRKVNQNGQAGPLPAADQGWAEEISLDLDAVSSLCPNCHILLVEANSSYLSDLSTAIASAQNAGARQISNSYGGNASSPAGEGQSSYPGVAVIASTGDHGYPGAGIDDYPASFPGFTAAGGTSLSATSTGLRGYAESAWTLSGGWGGTSGCNTQLTKPSWQTDTGCSGRAYADVSADADPYTGLSTYDSSVGGWIQMGGTSLSSPLIAAYEALTGVNGTSAQWAYQDAALLNDPTSGSSGSCAIAIAYICNAQAGYDGPTGIGSISGAVATGAPGVGGPTSVAGTYTQSQTTASANLSAGLYPNGLATSYYWQYGTSTAYGQQSATANVPAGTAPVTAAATLSGLSAQTTYHYRLVAANADGTYYGYDYTLTTNGSSPVSTAAPTLSGTPTQGQTLTTTNGAWNPPTGESFGYQWQRSADGTHWTAISGATNPTYTLTGADVGDYVDAVVIGSNAYGSGQAASGQVGTIASGAPHPNAAPTISGAAATGNVLNANSSWSPAGTSYAYQWRRSADGGTSWSAISGATAQAYTVAQADEHDLLEVTVTATNAFGSAPAASAAIGPVTSNPPVSSTAPTISGTSQRTYSLSATTGSWGGPGNTYAYQWQSSPDGSSWTNIAGATAATHLLGVADEGRQERVLITASNVDGIATATSGASQAVSAAPPGNQAPPTVSGTTTRTYALTATAGTWVGPDNTYAYQWQENFGAGFHDIYAATQATYTLGAGDEGATLRVVVTATNPDASIQQASAPTATVIAALPVNTTAPTLSGTAARASTLTANQGVWSGQGNTYALQWQRSTDGNTWTAIAGATSSTYTLGVGDENTYVRMMVTATNADGTAQMPSPATSLIPSAPPTNATAPAIAGTATRGLTLTSTPGSWGGIANSYGYQWQRSADSGQTWTAITGATASTYALATADEGDLVRLAITATNADAALTVASAPTATVQAAAPLNTAAPTVSGTAVRGAALSSTLGTWTGVANSYGYQWQRSGDSGQTWTAISGATAPAYTLTSADVGDELRLVVTASNPDATVAAPSAATAPIVSAAPVATSAPTISGTLTRSFTLTGGQGTWSGLGNSYALQWQRSADGQTWTDIASASSPAYVLGVADEGDHIRLAVAATNPDGTVVAYSAASAPIAAAPPVSTALPTVTGTPVRGQLLTGAAGSWLGAGNTLSYQWQASIDNGTSWSDLHGATGLSYTLGVGDEGSELRLVVTATNADATVVSPSAPTSVVAASVPANSAPPVVTGAAQRAAVLSATAGSWTGAANSYSYQWERDSGQGFVPITGATSPTYTVAVPDESARIEVVVTATNPDGTVQAASNPTQTVPSAPPLATVAPGLSGSAIRGAVLTGTQGTWSGIANTYAYQWQRSSDGGTTWTDINAAVSATYTLTAADEGDTVRLTVTATNPDATVMAASPATAAVLASPPANTGAPMVSGTTVRDSILSAATGTWTGLGNTVSVQWQRSSDGTNWLAVNGATGPSYTLGVADEGAQLRVLVTAANPDGSVSLASAPSGVVSAAPPVVTVTPAVSGSAQRASVLTATQGTWTGLDNGYVSQWQRSFDGGTTWTDVTGAQSSTYTLGAGDEGAQLRVLVTAANPDATVTAASTASAVVVAQPPVNTAAPGLSGTAARASTLSASTGTWSGAGNAYGYQWQSSADMGQSWTNIAGATTSAYTVVMGDEGHNLRVVVTATNPDATVAAASPATAAVQTSPPVSSGLPTITGANRLAAVLSAAVGTWTPPGATFAYQWQAATPASGYQNIAGATASSFTVTSGQLGEMVRVKVTASNPDGATTATSAPTAAILAPPNNTTPPLAPFGTLQDTFTLTADPGAWDASSTFTYQWVRCPAATSSITGACTNLTTGPTYQLTGLDVGSEIGVQVTATDAGGSTTAGSALTATITGRALANTSAPYMSGNPQVPHTLTANPGGWSVALSSVSYSWQRCDAQGNNCSTVATGQNTYTLSAPDAGNTIVLAVTATSPGHTATASSLPLLVSAQPVPQPSSLPTIAGSPARASALSVYPGTWTNSPTAVGYQWEACDTLGQNCQAIAGATSMSYTPVQSDEGHTLTVVATATNATGSGTVTAAPTAVVAAAPPVFTAAPSVVVLTDGPHPVEDGVLSTYNGTARGPAGTSMTVQWQRCDSVGSNCQAIAGAGGPNYQLIAADVGHTIVVADTATNIDASVVSVSHATAVVAPAPPRWLTLPTIGADPGHVGDVLTITPGTWSAPAPSSDTVTLMRCTSSCAVAATLTGPSDTYTISSADAGAVLRVAETAVNSSGHTSVWSAWYVGPVGSTVVAAGTVAGSSSVALRNSQGQTLAFASVAPGLSGAGDLARLAAAGLSVPRGVGAGLPALVVRVRAARGVHGRMVAWVCPVAGSPGGAPLPCTTKLTFTGAGVLRLPAWMDAMANPRYSARVPAAYRGKLRVVVKRLGR